MPSPTEALPGRQVAMPVPARHLVLGTPLAPPFPEHLREARFAMGCFWGAERLYWTLPGVFTTAVGYTAGYTPNPTYEEVCSGRTGHAEAVRVIYDPARLDYMSLLGLFFESHDPTQGMRQGNDVGTQYRSGIYWSDDDQRREAEQACADYGSRLATAGYGPVTTGLEPAGPFYYAEDYHQQYLARNPGGYCGLAGCGISFGSQAAHEVAPKAQT